MAKLSTLSLDKLYAKEKKSRATELAIISKEKFDSINPRYCESVCKLKCKNFDRVSLLDDTEIDILIVQDHQAPSGKYDRRDGQQEGIQKEVLRFVCQEAGFAGVRYRVVDLSKCEPKSEDYPYGKPPTATILTKCFPYLDAEIKRSKPKVIISLGTASTKALGLKKHSNTGNRGEIAISPYGLVVVTLHPKITTTIRQNARGNSGMYGPDYLAVIVNDFKKAIRLLKGEITYTETTLKDSVDALVEDGRLIVAKSKEQALELIGRINSLPEDIVISFDTETTSLDPLDPTLKVLVVQFGWRDPVTEQIVSAVFPMWHRENKYYDPDEIWPFIAEILVSERPKVGHNAKYDILVIWWSKNIRVKNLVFDTLLILHSIESGAQGTYSLKAAVWDHLLELGFAGYENDLGDLKKLQREADKAAEKLAKEQALLLPEFDEDEAEPEADLSEWTLEPSEEEQIAYLIDRDD